MHVTCLPLIEYISRKSPLAGSACMYYLADTIHMYVIIALGVAGSTLIYINCFCIDIDIIYIGCVSHICTVSESTYLLSNVCCAKQTRMHVYRFDSDINTDSLLLRLLLLQFDRLWRELRPHRSRTPSEYTNIFIHNIFIYIYRLVHVYHKISITIACTIS